MVPSDEFLDISQTLSLVFEVIVGANDYLRLALKRLARLFGGLSGITSGEIIVCNHGICLLAIEKPELLLHFLGICCGIEWGTIKPLLF